MCITPASVMHMGYYTTFTGEVRIDPPLTANELRESPYVLPAGQTYGDYDLTIDIHTETRETDEGTLTVRSGVALVPLTDESYKGYSFEQHLREAVKQLATAGHRTNGMIRAEGEETGDIWRMVVRDSEVTVEKAVLMWPDGTTEAGR